DGIYDEARSYEAVGRFVVRNCDLLIAIWDGKPPRGRGGTFDMVRFAAETGTPVWWIHADNAVDPVWLNDTVEPRADPNASPAMMELRTYLERLIVPPSLGRHHGHSIIERMLHCLRRTQPAPHLAYLREAPCGDVPFMGAHAWLLRAAALGRPPWHGQKPERREPVGAAWRAHFDAADLRSGALGRRYRSVYVWVFALVAVSLIAAAVSLGFPQSEPVEWIAGPIEAAALVLLVLLIGVNIWCDWHQRWIDYRL